MTRTFIMTQEFDKNWKSMGLTDDDLKALQEELIYSLCSDAAETLISMSLASVFIYITEKIPVSIFVLLILKLVSAVVEMLNGSARDILERLYFTEILRNAWTELVLGAAGKSIFTLIFCLICYLAICVGAIHFTFGRKELSF